MFGKKKRLLEAMTPEEAYTAGTAQKKRKDSLPYYLHAAKNGHKNAMYRLAEYYKHKKDMAQSLNWYEKAAEAGHIWAQSNCGDMYKKGEGCKANPERAFYWYGMAAAQGHSWSMRALAEAYEEGSGCTQDIAAALQWHELAAVAGNRFSAAHCAKQYESGQQCEQDLKKALHYYETVRNLYEEEMDADRRRGLTYGMDHYFRDIKRAREDINRVRKALGMPEEPRPELKPIEMPPPSNFARIALLDAERYEKTNPKLALHWYRYAAEKENDYIGQYNYALMLYEGRGCDVDKKSALYWFEKAAEQGDLTAQLNAGILYRDGEGCEDAILRKAMYLYWFEKAAKQGDVEAMVCCGNAYYLGEGCQKNERRACYWYEEAAMRGSQQAMDNLNILLQRGVHSEY